MISSLRSSSRLTVVAAALLLGCASARPATPIGIPAMKHTPADTHFMTGMIHHHAQAVLIARWAPTHGAGADLQRLCERIVVGQNDEITMMNVWLKDRGEPVPDGSAGPMKMTMNGMTHEKLMPVMLNDAEIKALDAARGPEFDRLFLIGMIKHHEGALTMVEDLFASQGAAQDETVFRFASDVFADQTTEIRVMEEMLAARGHAVPR